MSIFKVQRPLFSTVPNPPCLAYDRGRQHSFDLPLTPELRLMFGERMRIYCAGHIENGSLILDNIVPDRPW